MTSIQELTTTKGMTDIQEFVDYVDSFYGQNDPLYPMMSRETKQPLTQMDIHRATANYLPMCLDEANKFCTWGDGDSLDRERVRDILLEEYNYKFVGEQMKYNVKEVEFEFCLDYAKLTFDEQIEIRDLALGVWEADDEDDLLEEITASTGWLIESIDYDIQLK